MRKKYVHPIPFGLMQPFFISEFRFICQTSVSCKQRENLFVIGETTQQ